MTSWSPTVNTSSFDENWNTVLLSLRDLRSDVPINYNQYPGVVLTSACFSDKRYTSDKAACIANLIAIGYRRFVVDLYFDNNNGGWGICPVSFPVRSLATTSSTQPPPTSGETATIASSETPAALLARQASALPSDSSEGSTDPVSQYTCDDFFNATALLFGLESWITGTDTDMGARILLLDLNLHEISPASNGSSPLVPEPLLETLQRTGIFGDAYTPLILGNERTNLNSSWFGDRTNTNSSEYFTVQNNAGDIKGTEDGWPSEAYLEFVAGKRVLVSFGTIAAGLAYDPAVTGDDSSIFPSGYLGAPVIYNGSSPKCFFSGLNHELKDVNSSWAQVVDTASTSFLEKDLSSITGLTNCGYSTTLNSTYSSNITSFEHYFNHIKAGFSWAWDVNEPSNTTVGLNEDKKNTFRCAAMSASDGRWRVNECGERKLAACRIQNRPYDWKIASRDGTYYDATSTCSEGTDGAHFDSPRNAVENQYLLAAIKNANIPQDHRVWLDLNSLEAEGCWVTGGENATCPYKPEDKGDKEVIVSVVAAVIVLIVFGLMWFAKVGSWRVERSRRKRRKMLKKRNLEGVEYEGVPS